jgi:hypothetical protein
MSNLPPELRSLEGAMNMILGQRGDAAADGQASDHKLLTDNALASGETGSQLSPHQIAAPGGGSQPVDESAERSRGRAAPSEEPISAVPVAAPLDAERDALRAQVAELAGALEKAADTFQDFAAVDRALGKPLRAAASEIAENHARAVLDRVKPS